MRAVLLDALGTLLALEPPAPRLRARLRARHGLDVAAEECERALRAEIGYYRAHHLEGHDPASLLDLRRRCATVLRAALGPPAAGLATDEVLAALLGALRFDAYPDAAPALRTLGDHGLRRVVVSNWDCALGEALAGAGLGELVDDVVTSAQVGVAKPGQEIFTHALARARAAPSDAVHVGDSPREDVEGARAAGLHAVLLVRDGPPEAGALASLAGLPAYLGLR